jgi:rhodanese-related sulfurtransferase
MEQSEQPMELTAAEAARWRAEGRDFAILDVREPAEHAISRIEGATLLPLRQLPQRLGEIDPGRPLLVYCHYGMRSLQAVQLLRSRGFAGAVSLSGGIDAWSREVDPAVPRY